MISIQETYAEQGFVILQDLLTQTELQNLERGVGSLEIARAGSRNLLSLPWCREFARKLGMNARVAQVLSSDMVAIQCTYFQKTAAKNWLVPLHRDGFVPLKEKIPSPEWQNWTVKEGVHFCCPPPAILKTLVAIRVHLDANDAANGPLRVVPGSHRNQVTTGKTVSCHVSAGGALVFHPLLLHASSKVKQGQRRVLHFLFGPKELPDQAEWEYAV